MLNELSLYVLVVHSAHQKSSVNSDIQGRVDRTRQCWWDKPPSKLEDRLIINHLYLGCATFRCISTLVLPWESGFFSYQSFTTCGLHAVSRRRRLPSITAYSKYLCGQLDSAVAVGSHQWCSNTLELASCFILCCSSVVHLFCYSMNKTWQFFKGGDVFRLSVDFCCPALTDTHYSTTLEWAIHFGLIAS